MRALCCENTYSLTSSRRVYYIFSGPPCGIIFSEYSEKNFSVNETVSVQPNKCLIHLHFKN